MASQHDDHVSKIPRVSETTLKEYKQSYESTIDELATKLKEIVKRPEYDRDVVVIKESLDEALAGYESFLQSCFCSSSEDFGDTQLLIAQLKDSITTYDHLYRTYIQECFPRSNTTARSSHSSGRSSRTRSSRKSHTSSRSAKLLAEAKLIEIEAEEKELMAKLALEERMAEQRQSQIELENQQRQSQIEFDKQRAESYFLKRKAQAMRDAADSTRAHAHLVLLEIHVLHRQ